MKKTILAGCVAAMVFAITSCNGGSSLPSSAQDDSLAYYFGQVQGAQYLQYMDRMPEADRAKFNKDEFLKGLKAVLACDSTQADYMAGLQVGLQLQNQMIAMFEQAGVPFNRADFYKEFAAAFKADSVNNDLFNAANEILRDKMTKANDQIMKHQQEEQLRQQQELQQKASANIQKGKEYVDKQKKADSDIKTLESGVSYKVNKAGAGANPTDKDKVKVKYTGRLIDGTEFDSSKGEAVEFALTGVIPGFAEALKLMNPGTSMTIYIPSDQGYGVNGAPGIEPGSTLVFDVEMVEVVPAQ